MSRLIDADAFERKVMFGDEEDLQDVIYSLRDFPTAYDVDAVVKQLDEYITKIVGRKSALYQTVIQIVKGGGVWL